jgi:hypothetical protein
MVMFDCGISPFLLDFGYGMEPGRSPTLRGRRRLAGIDRTALPVPPARRISHHASVEFSHIKASNHVLANSGKGKPFAAVLNTMFAGAPISDALQGLEHQVWPQFFVVRAFDARGPPAPVL